jgi:sugar phosphate isomerase/epimerase
MTVAGSALIFGRASLDDAMAGLARLGFRTVELAALEGWAHIAPSRLTQDFATELHAVRDALAAAQLTPIAINAGLGAADPVEQERRAAALFDLAAALGCGVVTLPAGPPGEGVEAMARRLRPLHALAMSRGVALAVETHMGAITEDPAVGAELCRALPGLRLTLDPSHYWAGLAKGRGWEATIPFVAHVHLRDAGMGGWDEIQMWPGRGAIPFPDVVAALQRGGYAGSWAVEYIDSLPVKAGTQAAEAASEMLRQSADWGLV